MKKSLRYSTLLTIIISYLIAPTTKTLATGYFLYNFNNPGTLSEAGSIKQSWSRFWWVNSGGYLKISGGRGSTNIGALPANDPWKILYSRNNPTDTDQGLYPQNIFRLVSQDKWDNARQEAYFIVKNDNLSSSQNRNQSNGLLLFNRYQDGNNLYYTGIRVDGSAVIKKKQNGIYYTMAEVKGVYPGNYDKTSSPNLLPKNKWIGLRSEVINLNNGSVEIRVYVDKGWQGKWKLVANAIDDGKKYGGTAITEPGYVGIRTDFMDVEFENFRALDINKFTF